jgi:hypothetical protein
MADLFENVFVEFHSILPKDNLKKLKSSSKVGADLGPQKRLAVFYHAQFILGGFDELKVMTIESIVAGFKAFNEILCKISPTPETANEVKRIHEKYKIQKA